MDFEMKLYELKSIMVESIGILLSSITPSLVSLDAITSALRSIVMDWTLFPETSIAMVASELEYLIKITSDLLSKKYVSKFHPAIVVKLVDSANSMLKATVEHEHWNQTTAIRLRDSGRNSLKESLVDTLPGQAGFSKSTNDNYGDYSAKRAAANRFSACSTTQTWMPNFIPAFRELQSGDCITFIDDQDYGFELERRRQTEQSYVEQQVIYI